MRNALKVTLLTFLCLMCLLPAAAESSASVLEISNIFLYDRPIEGADQNPEVSLAANVQYREKITALAAAIDYSSAAGYDTANAEDAVLSFAPVE